MRSFHLPFVRLYLFSRKPYGLFFLGWLFTQSVIAGGFELSLNGYRQLGMGAAGIGLSLDGSTMYFNPGGLSFIRKRAIQLGTSLYQPSTSFLARTPSVYEAAMEDVLITPISLYLAWRVQGSRFTFGIGVNTPFGYETKWPSEWNGRFISQESSLNTVYIQPTISYQINEKWGVGVGLIYGFGNFRSQKGLPFSGPNNQEAWSVALGEGNGLGINLGVYFKPNSRLALGVNFRSPVLLSIAEGEIQYNVPASLEKFFPEGRFSGQFPLPGRIGFGLGYKLQEHFTLAFDFHYVNWGIQDTLRLQVEELVENAPPGSNNVYTELLPRNYKDAVSFRLGGEWDLNRKFFLRGGVFFDLSPVRDGALSPEFPDADRIGTTAGVGFILFDQLQVDLAYMFEFKGERTDILEAESFGGTYQSTTNIFGLGLGFMF